MSKTRHKKRVLLINPNSVSEKSILSGMEAIAPPLGLLYLASVLEKDFEVRIIDENIGTGGLIKNVKDFNPHFVGISANYSFQFPKALDIAKVIKKYNRDIIVVFGGVHVTFTDPKIILDKYSFIDFIIKGDGEYPLLDLVSGKLPSKIKGLSYRGINKIYDNGIFRINKLDNLPFPARHLIPLDSYRIHPFEYRNKKSVSIITSRGCAYKCINCIGSNELYRSRSPENVLDEIKYLYKLGIKDFTVYDPCFTLDMERAEKICDLIIKNKLKITWCCETRVDKVNKYLLEKMKLAGCVSIFYGIETGSEETLIFLNKKIDLQQVNSAVKLTKSMGIKAYGGFMIGYPFESDDEFRTMLDYSKNLSLDLAWFNIVTPFPGTGLWRISGNDEYNLDTLQRLSLYSGDVSFQDKKVIEDRMFTAVREFSMRPRIIKGLLLDLIFNGSLKRKIHLLKLLFFNNPFFINKKVSYFIFKV